MKLSTLGSQQNGSVAQKGEILNPNTEARNKSEVRMFKGQNMENPFFFDVGSGIGPAKAGWQFELYSTLRNLAQRLCGSVISVRDICGPFQGQYQATPFEAVS